MAFLTLESLLKTTTVETALQELIDILESVGFNATSWQPGSVQLTWLEMSATLLSNITQITSSIASFGFIDTSEGDALTAFSDSNYDNQRLLSSNTIGDIELTTAAGEGPHVVAIGDLVVQDNVNGFTYRNIVGDTLTDAAPVTMSFEAETAGANRNVPNGTIDTLNTPLAGVTVNNPETSGPPNNTWVTTPGIDQETDPDLRIRDRTKWALLTITAPADAYNNIVRNSTAAITRSTVDGNNPRGPGTVDIYIAGPEGGVGASAQTTAQTAVDARRPVTADPDVLLPVEVPTVPAATVFITGASNTEAERVAIEQAVLDFFNGYDIGGVNFGSGGVIPFAILSQTVTAFVSVQNAEWTTPTADIPLNTNQLATVNFANPLGQNFTYTDV